MRRTLPLLPPALALAALASLPLPGAGLAARQPPARPTAGAKPGGAESPAGPPLDQAEAAQLLDRVRQATRDTRSLEVKFTLRQRARYLDSSPPGVEGVLKLWRAADGSVSARCNCKSKEEGPAPGVGEAFAGLLAGDDAYLLNPAERTALRFPLAGRDKVRWLEKWFDPFVVFLDDGRVRRDFRLEVTKRDERYTYLAVEPKNPKRCGWLPDEMLRGRAVILNRATDHIPAGMPRQLWYTNDSTETLIEIQEWRANAPGGPTEGDFVRPEKLPGWKTVAFPEVTAGEK